MDKYKIFLNDKWIYGDVEKIIKNKEVQLFMVTNTDKFEINENQICKSTVLKDRNNNIIYDNDIINVTFEEGTSAMFIVQYNKDIIKLDGSSVYIDGLILFDFKHKPYLISESLLKNPEAIEYVGNVIENNMQDFIKKG